MSLEYAILGFLNYQSLSGYDLKKVFDQTVSHFWPATQSQIYRTLDRMIESEWVTQEVIEQQDRPDRKIYHITPQGVQELKNWLITPLSVGVNRSPALIQVFFSGLLSPQETLDMAHTKLSQMQAVLEHYLIIKHNPKFSFAPPTDQDYFYWMLTLDHGIAIMQAEIQWLERTIKRIENREWCENNLLQE